MKAFKDCLKWIAQKIEVVLWHVFAFIMKAFDRIVENDRAKRIFLTKEHSAYNFMIVIE